MGAALPRSRQRAEEHSGLHMRPKDRVLHYLLAEFDRPDLKHGSRLPTLRQIATRLKVSQPTVQNVFRHLAAEGRIRSKVGDGTFLVSRSPKMDGSVKVALSVPSSEKATGGWWITRVIGEVVAASAQSPLRLNLVPLPVNTPDPSVIAEKLLAEKDRVDALILSPVQRAGEIRHAYEASGKIVIDLNPPSIDATANFVSTDYFGVAHRVAKAWTESGRKRVVFLASAFDDSISELLGSAGFMSGFGARVGGDVGLRMIRASAGVDEDEAAAALQHLIESSGFVPDAVYCTGDHYAMGVLQVCRERGLRVPEDVSIVGGTGLDLSDSVCPNLTRVKQPFAEIGAELVSMLCQRIENKKASVPGRIVPTSLIGGATTLSSENAFLGIRGFQQNV